VKLTKTGREWPCFEVHPRSVFWQKINRIALIASMLYAEKRAKRAQDGEQITGFPADGQQWQSDNRIGWNVNNSQDLDRRQVSREEIGDGGLRF
jgi:hypothetical protein